ncbi:MAG TPA: class I SAM-dependent methyltransferase [Methylocella sp.]|nr:class I SAM-dependent methyltransferase [Methylocella sp.]
MKEHDNVDDGEAPPQAERLFSGLIGCEYDALDLIVPEAAAMSRRVGERVAQFARQRGKDTAPLSVLEIGCGTGVTTLALVRAEPNLQILSIDNEPAMLSQARENLAPFVSTGQVRLVEADALTALEGQTGESLDLVASAYAIHNFREVYRTAVLAEIFRVLRPGGLFVNGDRYALDEPAAHTKHTQEELRGYFKVFAKINRFDLLEQWVVHLFGDESPDHIMRLGASLGKMQDLGFAPVDVPFREGVNTLLTAGKPGSRASSCG